MWLTEDYNKDANALMMSRMLRKPLAVMKEKINQMLANDVEIPLKYMIYSAHDTQVVNMMDFLQKDYFYTPFASTVIFELKYSESCLANAEKTKKDCFGVGVTFNGTP